MNPDNQYCDWPLAKEKNAHQLEIPPLHTKDHDNPFMACNTTSAHHIDVP